MTYLINPSRFSVAGGGNPVVASLDFDGSTDYLTQSNSNWGSFTRSKWAVAGSFRPDAALTSSNAGQMILCKGTSFSSVEFALYIQGQNSTPDGNVTFHILTKDSGGLVIQQSSSSLIHSGNWHSFLVHYDSANGTSGNRVKLWVNNAAITFGSYSAPTAAVITTTASLAAGTDNGIGFGKFDGLIYSLAFFDNYLPTASEIFDGSAGKLKNISGVSGLKSLLTGSSAVDDYLLSDWTNNGSVTTSATIP